MQQLLVDIGFFTGKWRVSEFLNLGGGDVSPEERNPTPIPRRGRRYLVASEKAFRRRKESGRGGKGKSLDFKEKCEVTQKKKRRREKGPPTAE